MRTVLLLGAMIGLASCSDPAVQLSNPRTGMVVTCDANRAIDYGRANERCAQEYERQGYVRGTNWPPR
jgi:hypothetical protein